MMKTLLLLALSLLAACQNVERAAAPSPGAAQQLVSDLYRRHDAGDSPFFQTESRAKVDAYFEPSLATLIWNDAIESEGEVGAIGFDPLYNAQDADIKNLVVHPATAEGTNARVVVTFDNYDQKERLVFSLAPAGSAWRISDIDYGEKTTLRGILTAAEQP